MGGSQSSIPGVLIRRDEDRDAQREDPEKTQREDGRLQGKEGEASEETNPADTLTSDL